MRVRTGRADWPVPGLRSRLDRASDRPGAIFSAVAYTGGPFPLGYYGLGDLFVFLFFGLACVAGTYFVQAGQVSPAAWACRCRSA